ncbi:MAG: ketopantoate reductase family protein [Planctomycetota bacterium]
MSAERTFDRALILGAGAVGSFLGARLASVLPTVLVGREEHVAAVEEGSLRLSGELDETVRVNAATELPECGTRSLVVLAVKARSLPAAAADLASRAREGVTVLCVLNGLDPDEMLRRELASRGRADLAVLRALTSAGCNLVRPGEVEYWGGGLTFPDEPAARGAAELFEEAGVPVTLERDFRAEVWKKLAVNCVANPLSAVLGVRNREVVAPELDEVRRSVVEEVRACARDTGVELAPDLALEIDRALAGSNNRNSMLQDIERGNPTEIRELNGRVAEMARSAGRDAPACRTLARLVEFLEERGRGRNGG